jgi:RNA-directed DNA polymerase
VQSTSEAYKDTETKLKRIAWLSSKDVNKEYRCLMHLFNKTLLGTCFKELEGNKAVGIDGVKKAEYGKNLESNLKELITQMKKMAYRPQAVRRVMIPKEGDTKARRPLGISSFKDKLVQKMMQKILESIYEPIFNKSSYGFRPGMGCHDAIRDLLNYLYRNHVRTVIDVDLENFFGEIDHELLEEMLRKKIKDEKFMRYIKRMFKAGMLSKSTLIISDEGVPQGSCCSPVLANIFAHYVIDEWFEHTVKPRCRDSVELFRYCDDAVICCQSEKDAQRIKLALSKRLAKFKLKLNEKKTKFVSFSKWAYKRGEKQGSFDFLGFSFYWGKSRQGAMVPKVKTSGKRMQSKLKKVKLWVRENKDRNKLPWIWKKFCIKLKGHIRYYGVSYNYRVKIFVYKALGILYKWLNRRSQRKSFTWEKFWKFVERNSLPQIKVYHKLF